MIIISKIFKVLFYVITLPLALAVIFVCGIFAAVEAFCWVVGEELSNL